MKARVLHLAVGALATSLPATADAWVVHSTSYSPCSSGTVMADGTPVRAGSAANNALPLGTRITISPSFFGRRRFTVRDRIGSGSQLDLWTASCAAAHVWGRRAVEVTVGWPPLRRARLVARLRSVEFVPPRATAYVFSARGNVLRRALTPIGWDRRT